MIQGFVKSMKNDQVRIETPDHSRFWIECSKLTGPCTIGDVLVEDAQTGRYSVDPVATEEREIQAKLICDRYFN